MRDIKTPMLAVIGGVGVLMGLALGVGGIWLIFLGGSWFYLPAGLALIAAGYFVIRRDVRAVWISCGLLVVAALWSFADVGFDFWQLVPRLMTFLVVALIAVLISPWLKGAGKSRLTATVRYGVSAVLAVVFVSFIAGMFQLRPIIAASGEVAREIRPDAGVESGNDWPQYGRSTSGTRYAPFTQIDKNNVKDLKIAWTYRTGDIANNGAEFQSTPTKIGDTVYICTPRNIVAAVDAETGKERWKFNPHASFEAWQRCRGVGYAETPSAPVMNADGTSKPTMCQRRIVLTTNDARLMTIDAVTGELCTDFGDKGYVNLLQHLGPSAPNSFRSTSAPMVAGDRIIVGGMINDNAKVGEPSGVVRAFDTRTGAIIWAWEASNPKRGKPLTGEGEIYTPETPNVWGTMTYDANLGLVYLPTGNQTPDFWGGNRLPGSEEYNSSVVAVDVRTGVDRWHFRTVNHDLWDLDVSAQPILYDRVNADGTTTPLLIALTKRGQIFVLDRRDGTPVFDVEYRPAPTGAPEGDHTAPTQPYSAISIGTAPLKESDMWGMTIFDQLYCRVWFKTMRYDGEFTPSNTDTSIIFPGYYGGMNWGGGAVNEATGTLLVNDIRMAEWSRLIPQEHALNIPYQPHGQYNPQIGTPYGALGSMMMSPIGIPCFKPPYGTLSAVDLYTGKIKWQVPMGTIEDNKVLGIRARLHIPIGMPTMGGPLTTKGGVTFFHGTQDFYIRALDSDTGKELWKDRLPVAGQAAPMSYVGDENGKQYVVITAGGQTRTGSDEDRGDYVIAYTLP